VWRLLWLEKGGSGGVGRGRGISTIKKDMKDKSGYCEKYWRKPLVTEAR